jgi:biotin-dependent carboxylase-like uncharacterized protein
MLRVISPGLQTTVQASPRTGYRHYGIPYSGPADPLSMALANRLVANALDAPALEITYGGFSCEILNAGTIAITGAEGGGSLSGKLVSSHHTLRVKAGDALSIDPPEYGVRTYLAVAGGFEAKTQFGSSSTYLPAALGGHYGRALQASDTLNWRSEIPAPSITQTPEALRRNFTNAHAIRACTASETHLLDRPSKQALFVNTFTAGRQGTRMGITLEGTPLTMDSQGQMPSAPVFPGTVQCPPSGQPIILLCDAGTTGGYPRIAHIAQCDRHILGQIRPGDSIQFLHRTPEAAARDYTQKRDLLSSWLGSTTAFL